MAENTGKNGQTTTESEKKSDFSWTYVAPLSRSLGVANAIPYRQPHPLFVIVFVGPEKTPFGIQKTFLCHRSAFFRDLLASRDKQEDKVEDTVDLPDVSVEIFGLLQYFIYTGKVAATDESIPPYDVLVGLWKLGHRLGVDGLCDMTLSTMIRCRRTTGRIPSTPLLVQVWKDTPEGSPIRTLLLTWAAEYMRSSDSRAEFAKSLPQEVLSELVVAMSSLEAARPAAPQPVAQHSAQATPSSTQRKNVHYLDEPSEEEHLNGVKKTRRVDGTGSLPSASPLHDAAAQLNRRPSRPILVKPQKRRSSAAFVDPSTFTTAQKMEFCSDLLARMLSGPGLSRPPWRIRSY